MREITKQTGAGEATIRVSVTAMGAMDDVRAYLGGKEIGEGYAPLKAVRVVNGKTLVAYCGQLGLTIEDVDAIKVALVAERAAWELTPEGIASREASAKWDRTVERNAQVARNADINKWGDA